ncbi:MAG: hypothetical protein KGK08_14665, partial [Acidobacteriota bacterium]|nr:hypothetical protein [Acidobacteriota bacterium]
IVFNPADPGANGQPCDPTTGLNCTPYVDTAGTGVWASTDARLLDSPAALDALTGDLLYVAGSQYYANFRDKISTLDGLNRVKTPISGFLGVVSTTYDVEYINGTAFQVLPGGLLIDMKGIQFNGTWRIDQPATYAGNHFKLVGHVGSSLEHETWQQLTGYDAISTVRGIQMALFNNAATLVNPVKNATTDTTATMYPSFHYAITAPAGFAKNSWNLFGTAYESWSNPTATANFIALRPNVQGYATTDPNLSSWTVPGANTPDSLFSTYSGLQSQVQGLINSGVPLLTNINLASSGSLYSSYDVIGASTTATGFTVASYARTSTTAYNFVINQTAALGTATYTVPVNLTLAYLTNQQTTTITLPAGYSISGAAVTSGANFVVAGVTASTVTLGESAAHAAGSYSVGVLLSLNGGTSTATTTLSVNVGAGGRWVAGTSSLSGSIAITNTAQLSCAGTAGSTTSVTYTDTPTNLMTDLQGCFNNLVNVYALAPYISFFNPAQALYFRAVPTVATDQLTSKVIALRNDLYLRDQTVGWVEYLIPSTLSVGSNFRFGVDLRMYHDTPTGNVTAATYEIVNDNGLAAGGGLVGPPFRRMPVSSSIPVQGVAP